MSKAFVPFITAGDPSLDVTKELILENWSRYANQAFKFRI